MYVYVFEDGELYEWERGEREGYQYYQGRGLSDCTTISSSV